ncbi:hypothetical protein BJ508DRAFT_230879 [Ascobolus immersus RN42]|uniref:BSD domain-containing protein n=1 Tax=Ascobolus immersus RN42 TaxID=1160509 RepID=A0A3N4HX27_ASCIM|nr:hypothetical protein BJ508DRAFT_230879 [Ascobolus immersus RN42]
MTDTTSAPSLYKKKEGTLTADPSASLLTWTPNTAGPAPLTIPISCISNLQATPPTSAKVMIKVFALPPDAPPEAQPETHVFNFTVANARALADAVKDTLTTAIQTVKAASIAAALPAPTPELTPAAATALLSRPEHLDLSEKTLLSSFNLHTELLQSSPQLNRLFTTLVISGPLTPPQFWSTRLPLLRAFAIDRAQRKGPYNVLAAIKPKTVDNVIKMSLSREQIREIFEQHPVVRRAYDETVPGKLSEDGFWKRFFGSGLFRQLRGETARREDDVLDRFMDLPFESNELHPPTLPIPTTLSLSANAQNTSFTGNRPDLTMRPTSLPIQRTLNSLSIKLLDSVTPADALSSHPEEPQRLADLEPPPPEDSVRLHVQRLESVAAVDGEKRKEKPARPLYKALLSLSGPGSIDLAASAHPTSPSSFSTATNQITNLLNAQASSHKQSLKSLEIGEVPEVVTLCHGANMEFLRHFYNAFLSGDSKRMSEAGKIIGSVERGLERSKAVKEQLLKEAEASQSGTDIKAVKAREREVRRAEEVGGMLRGGEECLERAVGWWGSVNA